MNGQKAPHSEASRERLWSLTERSQKEVAGSGTSKVLLCHPRSLKRCRVETLNSTRTGLGECMREQVSCLRGVAHCPICPKIFGPVSGRPGATRKNPELSKARWANLVVEPVLGSEP